MTRWLNALLLAGTVLLSQGCFDVGYKEAVNTSPSVQSWLGEWRSANTGFPASSQACSDLAWNITSQSATAIEGVFEATCTGGVKLTGTASGVIDGTIQITAAGTASGLGSTSCNFTLSGTGVLQVDQSIRVDYTGQTCVGAISGTEVIRRR